MTPRESFIAFARSIHAQCPNGHSVDLRRHVAMQQRALCGQHGRVIPTQQGFCPDCGGYALSIVVAPSDWTAHRNPVLLSAKTTECVAEGAAEAGPMGDLI